MIRREAIRGVYVPPIPALILCLNALKKGFLDPLGGHGQEAGRPAPCRSRTVRDVG